MKTRIVTLFRNAISSFGARGYCIKVRCESGYVLRSYRGGCDVPTVARKTGEAILAAETLGKVLDIDAYVIQRRKFKAVVREAIIGFLVEGRGKRLAS